MYRAVLTLALAIVVSGPLGAATSEQKSTAVDFARDVYPILQRSCIECHGPRRQEGELRLDRREDAFKGGANGPVISPGKPDKSELLRRISLPAGADEIMPATGKPLVRRQVEVIRDWIAAGATWPEKFEFAPHWAYVAPVRPAVPAVRDAGWPRTPIDNFVLSRLEDESLKPSPQADPAKLCRRLYLDLVGLSPSPAEVDEFVRDSSPEAYDKLVDRLLASPQFGVRWARPWLDLARYADSHGFQRDDLRELWPYRDWVIDALNSDMPFDRFTIEQIAGDLLPGAGESQRIATGFNRCATTNVEAGSEPEETRVNQVIDRLNTMGYVWLGTTLECAQCHDQKFDPFKQRDYYALMAFFNNTAIEADRSNPKTPGSIRFLGPWMTLHDATSDTKRRPLEDEARKIADELFARRAALEADMDAWQSRLLADVDGAGAGAAETHVLEIGEFSSSEGAGHKVLEDQSVLLVDDPPDQDTYTAVCETPLRGITGFKIEALTDPSLPGGGPGRSNPPNFVVTNFTVTAEPLDKSSAAAPLALTAREASFEQKKFGVETIFDRKAKNGWGIAPKFHTSHWATFAVSAPVDFTSGARLVFTIEQGLGKGRTIGRLRLSAFTGKPSSSALPADVVAISKTPADTRSKKQRDRLVEFRLEQDEQAKAIRARQEQNNQALQEFKKSTTLVMQELDQPRAMNIFTRGDYRSPGAAVEPGVPSVLHSLPDSGPRNRLALARWLVDRKNPLAARVVVNRWWAELFGHGIVTTMEDFGIKGDSPTHPELLDWLACEFMDEGWSMKHLLRRIVTSSTYRQSSKATSEMLARDDRNLFYERGPRFRLDAETIRDTVLESAGLLCVKLGGPPIRPYQPDNLWTKVGGQKLDYVVSPGEERYRRGIYVVWKRASPYPSFVNFDATARLACTVRRSRSNTPLQALTLLNDPVYVEAACGLAERVLRERPDAPLDDQLRYAFRVCLARGPSDAELDVLRKLHADQLAEATEDPRTAGKLIAEAGWKTKQPAVSLAAWYGVAAALINLDETITKN